MPDPLPEPEKAVQELLALRLVATLGTTNDDGSILLTPIWYLYEADRLYLPTGSRSRKARNLLARPAVTIAAPRSTPPTSIRAPRLRR